MASPVYQQSVPIVNAIPLNVLQESDVHTSVSPVNLHQQQQQLQLTDQGNDVHRSSYEHHHYSEINSDSSSSLSLAAEAGHVTETDTPTAQVRVADAAVAVYSGLDTATTISGPTSLPSVYQTLIDTGPLSSTSELQTVALRRP